MAAKSGSAWGVGTWAADLEKEEEEEKEKKERETKDRAVYSVHERKEEEAFPTLGDAMSKQPKKKEKKGKTLSLSEFTTGVKVAPFQRRNQPMDDGKLTVDEMMKLPRGPRERDESEEQEGGLGGGFKGYGGFRGGLSEGGRGDSRDGGFGRDRDRGGRERDSGFGGGDSGGFDDGPSRSDESNWGAAKKFVPSAPGGGGGVRGGSRGGDDEWRGSDRDGPSRADGVDNWGAAKKFVPAPAPSSFGGGGGSDRRRGGGEDERRSGVSDGPSRADEVDNWGAAKKFVPSGGSSTFGRGGSGSDGLRGLGGRDGGSSAGADSDRWTKPESFRDNTSREEIGGGRKDRPRLVLSKRSTPIDSEIPSKPLTTSSETSTISESRGRPSPFGNAKPREEVLAEKEKEVVKEKGEGGSVGGGGSGSVSRETSRPQTPEPVRPRPRPNPFGDAKPREVLLEEKGKDWKQIDRELESRTLRLEIDEEKKVNSETDDSKAVIEGEGQ